jgi:hypothetical protein
MDQALSQIARRIRAVAADATPLRIRGGGTKDFHGEVLQGDVLDTAALTGITSYEPSELVVTVRAGTPLAELEAALAEKGQCLPFEPPHFGENAAAGTVGGMVAAGLSGPARASVGAVRDYVLGATLVNGRGEVLTFGGQVMKNVAGYDVSRVLAGSLGTLGVIAEVSLKVLPVAPAEATLEFTCNQADALRLLNEWGGRPLPLNASCWFEQAGVGTLYLRLRGAVAAVGRPARTWAASARRTRSLPLNGDCCATNSTLGSPPTKAPWRSGACRCRRPRRCSPSTATRRSSNGTADSAGTRRQPNTPHASATLRMRPADTPRCSGCPLPVQRVGTFRASMH